MRLRPWVRWTLLALLLSVCACVALASHLRRDHLGKPFGVALTFEPAGKARGVVVVMAERARRRSEAAQLAQSLADRGLLVALVPAGQALAHVDPHHCELIANSVERVGRRLMRQGGVDAYFAPMLVGADATGGALARLAVANALPQTVVGAVLNGPAAAAPAGCAVAPSSAEQGFVLEQAGPQAVADAVVAHLPRPQPEFRGLPLIELPAAGSHRLAIFISGDGGWRSLDKGVSSGLRAQGVSVVGWDSLRYFWSRRTPEETAADLAAVIDEYRRRWHADEVELIGYSFGADAMPFLYNRLPPATRASVRSISLLGLGHDASFRVSVGGWLGTPSSDDAPVEPELAKLPPGMLLCVYGEEEKDTLCPALGARGIHVAKTGGGHHFDHNIPAMVERLRANFERNAPAGAPAAK